MFSASPNRKLQALSADIAAAALLLLVCLAFYLPRLAWPVSAQDEGILLAYPALLLDGALPYRDFAALYTPGGACLVALAFALFGESILVERAVGLFYWWGMASALYFLGSGVSRLTGLAASGAVLVGLVFFPLGAYAMTGALALALAALLAAHRSLGAGDEFAQQRLASIAGMAAGAALWFRHDVGLLVSIALLCMFVSLPRTRLLRCLLGGCLVAAPLLVLLAAAGLPVAFESLVLDVLRNGPGRKLPIEPVASLLALFLVVAGVCGIAALAHVRKFPVADRALARGAAVLAAGLMPSVLQRADGWHIIYVAAPVVGLAVVLAGLVARNLYPRAVALRLSAAGAWCVVVVLGAIAAYSASRAKDTVRIVSGERWVYLARHASTGDLQQAVDEVNRIGKPGWRLFVGPNDLRYTNYNDTYLYFLFPQFAPATRFLEMNPGVANREGSGLAEQLGTADVVILNRSYDNWREPNASSVPGPDLANKVLERGFCEYRSFGRWRVMLKGDCPYGTIPNAISASP